MKLTILGAGSFGTAMANHAAAMGHETLLWCRRPEQAEAVNTRKENPEYLKGVKLHPSLAASSNLESCLAFSNRLVLAIPAQYQRGVLEAVRLSPAHKRWTHLLNLAKGIEIGTGCFMHQIASELLPDASYSVLSGPGHAEEVARRLPTALVAASAEERRAVAWQELLNDRHLRVYTSDDVQGVEIGGAMKNVIAIAVGVARALEFGDNSVAAIATRGLAEIMRYGAFTGANPMTFAGLAGIGDMMVTCYSMYSRNLRFGLAVGRGQSPAEAAAEIGQVIEGMHTCRALVLRARMDEVELPLSEGIYRVLYESASITEVLSELLFRDPKPESFDIHTA